MTLTTHAVTGAALAALMPNHPVIGFVAGFASHFILDAIPHWDYRLSSFKQDRANRLNNDMLINADFLRDLVKIGTDFALGFILSVLLFVIFWHFSLLAILCGAFGGMLPDGLQFVYMKWRHEPFVTLQKFHIWIHSSDERLLGRPLLGICIQAAFAGLVILGFFLVRRSLA